ncbi:hypothetical protein L1987_75436 [Smallanthus sonchifolius]|uniref:Uncharacterized protein n=1 Tax=Smallanthus sonchifolius TaxID=185202 RepID=A0ACB9A4Q0_9ASTR|nr:hypothetical protein L1987_75436 [Smallanthus sonchifolius]
MASGRIQIRKIGNLNKHKPSLVAEKKGRKWVSALLLWKVRNCRQRFREMEIEFNYRSEIRLRRNGDCCSQEWRFADDAVVHEVSGNVRPFQPEKAGSGLMKLYYAKHLHDLDLLIENLGTGCLQIPDV